MSNEHGFRLVIVLTQSDQARVAIQYGRLHDVTVPVFETITIDRQESHSPMRLRIRDENIATWTSYDIGTSSPVAQLVKHSLPTIPASELSTNRPVPYTVRVRATTQRRINGAPEGTMTFLSIVVNQIKGWVVIPQAMVPSSMCSLRVIFEDSVELPATKVFEGTSGRAIAEYNPDLIEGSTERAIFSDTELKAGNKVVGLWLPLFLSDAWSTSYVGAPVSLLKPALEELQRGSLPQEPRLLDVLLERISKNDATAFGVPEGI